MTENILQVKRNDEFYYPIVFRKNFEDLSNQLKTLELQERKCCIVTDSNVAPIYLETVKKNWKKFRIPLYPLFYRQERKIKRLHRFKIFMNI